MKTPHELAEERITLAEEYSRYSDEFTALIKSQADFFNANRNKVKSYEGLDVVYEFKSDTACQRAFEATDEGVKMTQIKQKLKSIEKTMSAYNTMLRLLENEAKNLY